MAAPPDLEGWGGMVEYLSSTLRWEDPLEEGMAAHSSILAWRIPWTEEPGGMQSTGLQFITGSPLMRDL